MYDFMRIADLKEIIKDLPDEMLVVIPVIDEENVNRIYAFRKVRTAGVLRCEEEAEDEKEAFCLNGAMDGMDIANQISSSGVDPVAKEVLYGEPKYGEE